MATAASRPSETTTLLAPNGLNAEEQAMSPEDVQVNPYLETTWKFESLLLLKYTTPLTLTYFLQYVSGLVAIIVAGHIGRDELAAISLANLTAGVTAFSIYEGLATSLDTLCSQAYGSGKKKLVGLHLQRMVYFLWATTIPVGIIWICSPWILAAIVPEKHCAELAGSYLRFALIGAPGWATFEASKRFVQSQGDFSASLMVLLISVPINIFLNWLFVWQFELGLDGSALAAAVTNTLQPILLLLYCCFVAPRTLECWPGFTKASLRNWSPMIRLALPGLGMVFTEWLAFNVLTFSTSYISTVGLAAQSVIMTIASIMYHIPFPTSIAAATRLGNLIGSGAIAAAKITTRTYAIIFMCIGLFDLALLVSLKEILPKAFTQDEEVRALVAGVMPLVAALQFFDATAALCNGVLRSLGRQYIGGWVNLAVYYIFVIPLALFLAFGPPKLGLYGIWTGPASGLALVTFADFFLIRRTSWEKAVEEARNREE